MKKLLLAIALIIIAFAQTAWAQFSGGTGTETDPYLISSVADWNTLANNVNNGTSTYSGQYFKMTANIGPITTMIGCSKEKSFQGTFDGDGHMLDVNLNTVELCTAPFRYVQNVTIKRLHVTGAIKTNERCSGSIVALAYGNCTFISCHSSVSIEAKSSSTHENGFHGGLVGFIQDGYFIFDNCLFDGKIKIKNFDWVGGFVGYIYQPISGNGSVVNCYFNPESCSTGKTSCARTFISRANYDDYKHYTITNSYYTHKICDPEGTNASGWSNSRLLTALGSGWHEVGGKVVPDISIDYYSLTGDGTVASPYLIASANDWNGLARNINIMGENYKGKHFRLTQNITVAETFSGLPTTMLGVNEDLCFQGTFDGGGHTITLDYIDNRTGGGNENYYCGPFRYINGATIQNLHVDGTIIKADKKHAGGFVGKAYGDNNIINCRSSVDIQSSTNGDGSHGGFLGDLRDGTTNFNNCVFDGSLQGTNTKNWGGFVGWVADGEKAKFTNCMFAPTLVNVKNDGNKTFARRDDGDDLTFTNCYYTKMLGSAQGKEACTISGTVYDNGTTVTVTPNGTAETGTDGVNNLTAFSTGNDTYNPCVKYGEVLYSASGNNVQLILNQNGDTPSGAQEGSFIATPGSISGTASPYTLNMPNTATTISLAPTDWLTGHLGVYSDPYPIYTTEQWNLLAERVNGGNTNGYVDKYFKLMADITVSKMVGSGSSDSQSFRGIFDGNGHTLNVTLSGSGTGDGAGTAPFKYISGATIKNLHVTGTITTTGMRPASIASFVVENSTITNCWSEVSISSSHNSDIDAGGFVARVNNGKTLTITDCLFSGNITYSNSSGNEGGGMVGYTQDNATATLTNCYFAPSSVSFAKSSDLKMYMLVGGKRNHVTINNCYYNNVAAAETKLTVEGTNASGMSNEALREALGEAWEVKNNQVVPIMTRYLFSGSGNSASSPYLISSVEDWNGLVGNVYLGENYTYTHFQLTDDISVTRMVGNASNAFKGHFDGDGNTLTFTANTSADYTAPFRYVDGADIKNLVVDGTITTSAQFAAGFIGYAQGTYTSNEITNCRSSITINSSVVGDGTHGGFIANIDDGTTHITGCVFNGKLLGSNTESCGGFVGWTKTANYAASLTIKNSLFAPIPDENTVSNTGSSTFSRHSDNYGYYIYILNSYYSQALGTAQGKLRHSITATDGIAMERIGTATEYNVSGITVYSISDVLSNGLMYNEVLYAGENEVVELNLALEEDYIFGSGSYTVDHGTLAGSENPYTLTMANDDAVISGHIVYIPWDGTGTEEDPYQIETTDDLDCLAAGVYSGYTFQNKYFEVINDLVYTYTGEANENNYTPIGNSDNAFCGHFNGQGYAISGIRIYKGGNSNSDQYLGLFGNIGSGGEAKNIVLTDSDITGYQYIGGIAGRNAGQITDNMVFGVTVSNVLSGDIYGAILGYNNNGVLERNYYVGCTVAGVENAIGVGCNNVDITANDGAVPAYLIDLEDGITATGQVVFIVDDVIYNVAKEDTNITLSGKPTEGLPAGYTYYYTVNSAIITDDSFDMPNGNVTIGMEYSMIDWAIAYDGDSEATAYEICCTGQLNLLATRVNNGTSTYSGKYFKLMNDIAYDPEEENNYAAIGIPNYEHQDLYFFDGNFDGQGFTISGVRINSTEFQGLFGYVGGNAVIRNVVLSESVITGNFIVGGFVGLNRGGTVTNCRVTNTVTINGVGSNPGRFGGIVGYNENNSEVSHCISSVTITTSNSGTYLGGIVGINEGAISHNLTVGATIPTSVDNHHGAIASSNNILGSLSHNYYAGCTVAGVDDAINVGCDNADVNENYGAVSGITHDVAGYGDGAGKWTFIASPVATDLVPTAIYGLVGNEISAGTYDYDLFRYNPTATTHQWENYLQHTSDFVIENGQGYLFASKEDKTLVFPGACNDGSEKTVTLGEGWNLVGNPFNASAYVDKPFYKMNAAGTDIEPVSNYDNYNNQATITAFTGIVVDGKTYNNITFNKVTPVQQNANNNGGLTLTLTRPDLRSDAVQDKTIVSFNEGAELEKFIFNEDHAKLYFPQNGNDYAIAYSDRRSEMPLHFKATETGTYTITVETMCTSSLQGVRLIDKFENVTVDLGTDNGYTFTASSADRYDRFVLVFGNAANASEDGIFAYQNGSDIIVEGEGTLEIYDVMGRMIAKQYVNGVRTHCVCPSETGVYVLKLNGKTQKIVIR